MLKDITIGQYFPGNSIIHRLDARFKIIITIIFIIMLFVADGFASIIIGVIFMIMSYILTRIPVKLMFKSLRPVIPILFFTAVLNVFFYEGDVIFHLWFIKITDEGVKNVISACLGSLPSITLSVKIDLIS